MILASSQIDAGIIFFAKKWGRPIDQPTPKI